MEAAAESLFKAWNRCRPEESPGSFSGLALEAQTTMAHSPVWAIVNAEGTGLHSGPGSPRYHDLPGIAGVPFEQLQQALIGWVEGMVEDLNASVDGKWAKQSEDGRESPWDGECPGPGSCAWPTDDGEAEPKVLRAQLGQLFEHPGLQLPYGCPVRGRDLCQASMGGTTWCGSKETGQQFWLPWRTGFRRLNWGNRKQRPKKKSG